MGSVVTIDGVARVKTDVFAAVAGEYPLLVDTNGTLCCCSTHGCCSSCVKNVVTAGCGTCAGVSTPDGWPNPSRDCCYTRDSDYPVDGYWYEREDLGSNYWSIEVTQTGDASWGGTGSTSYWEFAVSITEACRVSGNLTTTTYADVARLSPGFERSVVQNYTCHCRHLNLPFNFTQVGGCWRDRWDILFHPMRDIGGGNTADQFGPSSNCYEDSRAGVGGPIPRSGGLVTVAFYYRVDRCAQRCTGDCTTCP